MSDSIRINGVQHSWSSTKLKIDGEPFYGITAINYGDALEVVKGYGMGRHHGPRGRSAGKYTVEPIAVKMFKSSAQALREQLAAKSPSGTSYGRTVFQMVLQFVEPDDSTITVEFEDCRWTKDSSTNEEGPDPLQEETEFDCMRIRRNGLVLYDDSEG